MSDPAEILSVLVAVEFVVMSAIVLVLVPLADAVWIVPLVLVFLVALQLYRS